MSIDGINGPKGPQRPDSPEGIDKTDSTERTGRSERFSVAELANEAPVSSTQEVDPTVSAAFDRVASDIQAGRIRDFDEGFRAVIDELVETRYSAVMTRSEKQRFAVQLVEVLRDDPTLGAQIQAMLRGALDRA